MSYSSREAWLDQFATQLCKLVLELTFDEAHDIAWSVYADMKDHGPEEAAKEFADGRFPRAAP